METTKFKLSQQGDYLASIDKGGRLIVWDLATEQTKWSTGGEPNRLARLVSSLDGTRIAAIDSDESIRVWDFESGKQRQEIESSSSSPISVALSASGELVAVLFQDFSVSAWTSDRVQLWSNSESENDVQTNVGSKDSNASIVTSKQRSPYFTTPTAGFDPYFTDLIIQEIEPEILTKLTILAHQHQRSVEEEHKAISS